MWFKCLRSRHVGEAPAVCRHVGEAPVVYGSRGWEEGLSWWVGALSIMLQDHYLFSWHVACYARLSCMLYMQKHAPQIKERTKLEAQASSMLGPQDSIDRADMADIFNQDVWRTPRLANFLLNIQPTRFLSFLFQNVCATDYCSLTDSVPCGGVC